MQHKFNCAVFDLDGTLINTLTDLSNACVYVGKLHGYDTDWTTEQFKQFVGSGMRVMLDRAFRHTLSDEALDDCLAAFLPYYNEHSLDATDAYDGIREQLAILKNNGIKTAVITNKAEASAVSILNEIFGEDAFDIIIGQREGLPTKPHPAGVFLALEALGCTADEALYFGDSNVDMQTAINAGLRAVAVTWGFRSRDELLSFYPYKIIDRPEEISTCF